MTSLSCLVCVTLMGFVTIDQDTTLGPDNPAVPGVEYHVVGDATLTMEAGIAGKIVLQDNAGFVMRGGELRSTTYIYGEANRLELLGGWHKGSVIGNGNATIYIDNGYKFRNGFNFTGGRQHFEVHRFQNEGPVTIISNGSETTADLYADEPGYSAHDGYVGVWCFEWQGFCYGLNMRSVDWKLYDADGRLDGDSNVDGAVDLADLNAVRDNFNRNFYGLPTTDGDTVPMDGLIDLTDLNRVRNNFGSGNPVPEPDAFLAAIISVGAGVIFGYILAASKHA